MSGFEIAGLVLGAFPLAIEGIKAYSNAMKTIDDIKNYQQILRQFARGLRVEKCKYRNTFLELLTELADPAKIERMMANLQSDEWNDEDFRSQLKGRLRPADETLDNWLCLAEEMNETLRIVIAKFKIPPQDPPSDSTSWRSSHSASTKFDPRLAWDVGMLSSYRAEKMREIRQLNDDLREFANCGRQSPVSASSASNYPTTKACTSLITYHLQIQHYAKSLYSVLREKLEFPMCRCAIPHSAYLELRMRRSTPPNKTLTSPQAGIHGPNQFLTFSLIFPTQKGGHECISAWQEFQLEPCASGSKPPGCNLKVENLAALEITPPAKKRILSPSTIASRTTDISSRLTPAWKKWRGQPSRTSSPNPDPSPSITFAIACRKTPPTQENHPTISTKNSQPVYTATAKKRARFSDDYECGEDDEVTNLPTIPSFCTTLATHTTIYHPNNPPKCVGLLISPDKLKHRVWAPPKMFPKPARLVSLADLINIFTNINTPSRRNRLILGLKLVSSVLQLNTTQWLTEIWEAKDILFPEFGDDPQDAENCHNILSRPFVRRDFKSYSTWASDDSHNNQRQSANQTRAVIGCNHSLYSLGIVLLEIWHWKTFSSLYSTSGNGLPELLFTHLLSEKLFDDAGEQYAIAVRRCIRGFETPGNDLEEDSFRMKVYQGVLGPLENNLQTFSGCNDIQKIIGEG